MRSAKEWVGLWTRGEVPMDLEVTLAMVQEDAIESAAAIAEDASANWPGGERFAELPAKIRELKP